MRILRSCLKYKNIKIANEIKRRWDIPLLKFPRAPPIKYFHYRRREQQKLYQYILPDFRAGFFHNHIHHRNRSLQKMYPYFNPATFVSYMYPTDSSGNICGIDLPNYPYLLFPSAPLIVHIESFSKLEYVLVHVPREDKLMLYATPIL